MKILITGATNGIGKGLTKVLSSKDKEVKALILLCRSKTLGQQTMDEIDRMGHKVKTSLVLCDLSKLGDVRKAIETIKSQHTFLDGIFINAGIGYAGKQVISQDGMDGHFQVNYLSQYILCLHLIDLLDQSPKGGRIIFNVTKTGTIHWQDLQLQRDWTYEKGIHQAMAAKRMFLLKLDRALAHKKNIAFIGFQVPKTVWTNQINIIPGMMRFMAKLMKVMGRFMSIEACGEIMAPLFLEDQEASRQRSGKVIIWKDGAYKVLDQETFVMDSKNQDRLWDMSLDLSDQATRKISDGLHKL